jgi:hypothetical protein
MAADLHCENATPGQSHLLALPPELRDLIFSHLLDPALLLRPTASNAELDCYDFSAFRALSLTSRQVSAEARRTFHTLNHFVRVATPWPEAQAHVEREGRVPMVCTGTLAEGFERWEALVMIDTPHLRGLGVVGGSGDQADADSGHATYGPGCSFVIQARDLVGFARMWYYSDMSHPGLNQHLRLSVSVRANQFRSEEYGESKRVEGMSKALQRMVILPFGKVKGLHETRITGAHDKGIEAAMREEMAVPYTSAEECVDAATTIRLQGHKAAEDKDFLKAIDLYCQAFEKIHIRCDGRRRNIYSDAWFVKTLESGLYTGQQGHLVRLVLRVQLVADIVGCYLGLQQWEEARFWGKRSIDLMREANRDDETETEDEPILGFPGADSVGLIYYRTAKACRMLKDKDEARRLCKVALGYLPNDEEIKHEWEGLKLVRVGGYGYI